LKTALGECTQSVVYLDARRLEEEGYTRQVLYELFSEEFSGAGGLWFKAKDYLKRVKGVHVGPVGLTLTGVKVGLVSHPYSGRSTNGLLIRVRFLWSRWTGHRF
jgi:hypothetical protein